MKPNPQAQILTNSVYRYQQVLGCGGIKLSNTSSLYARYTKSLLCNGIVANSKGPCDLGEDTATLCADTCVSNLGPLTPKLTLTFTAGSISDQ